MAKHSVLLLLGFVVLACSYSPAIGFRHTALPAAQQMTATPSAPALIALPTLTTVPATTPGNTTHKKILPPPQGHFYHGAYPGGPGGTENDISLQTLQTYTRAAGKAPAWVYFSHNWYQSRLFPQSTVDWIRQTGSTPYIRLMLISTSMKQESETIYTLEHILQGQFDRDLRAWAQAARASGGPLIAEYGVEVNGEWFPWNGQWHGAGQMNSYGRPTIPDGPERFVNAYRHIIRLCREEGANNITWVFHVSGSDIPQDDWNHLENYYPGNEWVDWIAVSIYGVQTPLESEWITFSPMLDAVYPRLAALSIDKPIIVAEFGVSVNPNGSQAAWAQSALQDIKSHRWPRIIGFSWWNEAWPNDDNPAHNTTMRLEDNLELAQVFRQMVGGDPLVLERLVTAP